jgi:hypothetical protein
MIIETLNDTAHDVFVPDAIVRAELNISQMTQWRWDRNPALAALGWPPPVRAPGGRTKHRSRRQLEQFKANMLQQAFAARGKKSGARIDALPNRPLKDDNETAAA